LRALCFLKKESLGDARECLKEELRFFPGNEAAAKLLEEVLRLEGEGLDDQYAKEDEEFGEILRAIRPYSMLPAPRLYTLFLLAKDVCARKVSGNFIECGVAGGGSTALLALVIKRYSAVPRKVYACDSYEGMPEPSEEDVLNGMKADDTAWGTGTCAAPEESVRAIAAQLGVEDLVIPIKGFFEDTLPERKKEIGAIACLHIDCDWYASAKTILRELYDQILSGANIQVDDYGYWEGMKKALDEFQAERGLSFRINDIDGMSAWFQK
jgi:hypothetical protein